MEGDLEGEERMGGRMLMITMGREGKDIWRRRKDGKRPKKKRKKSFTSGKEGRK